jgi:hypothetical protein
MVLLLVGAALIGYVWTKSPHRWRLDPRVTDRIGLLSDEVRERHEQQLLGLFDESGVDLRFLLVPDTDGESIERFAVRRARETGVGRKNGGRGVLVVYDSSSREFRIEVGPQLQGLLTDAFVGFIVREHARTFFEGGKPELGLRLLVRVLHWRIRDAQFGGRYDPSVEEYIADVRRLATGGGASGAVGVRPAARPVAFATEARSPDSLRFAPQPTVREAYARYLEWLALDRHVAQLPLFTRSSQQYLASLELSRAYRSGWLAMEYGQTYAVDERGDLAMVYFTGSPLVSPHFFRRTAEGWQLDLQGELRNTIEVIGGWYSWILLDSGDEFSRTFQDRYLPFEASFGTYYRVAGGDNRWILTRDPWGFEVRNARAFEAGQRPGVDRVTIFQAAERIRAVTRPSVVVLYGVDHDRDRQGLGGLVRLAEFCAAHGVELLAFDISDERTEQDLAEVLRQRGAPFPAVHIYRWRAGLLDSTFRELGITVGRSWASPLVAVRDRDGRLVVEGQRVKDWDAVIAVVRRTVE